MGEARYQAEELGRGREFRRGPESNELFRTVQGPTRKRPPPRHSTALKVCSRLRAGVTQVKRLLLEKLSL